MSVYVKTYTNDNFDKMNTDGLDYIYVASIEPINYNTTSSFSFTFVDIYENGDEIIEQYKNNVFVLHSRQPIILKDIPYCGLSLPDTKNILITIYGNFNSTTAEIETEIKEGEI